MARSCLRIDEVDLRRSHGMRHGLLHGHRPLTRERASMYIEVKFHGGEPIVRACRDACALANRIQCDVHFQFNDVYCMALQGGDPDVLVENFQAAQRAHPMATSHPMATTHPRQLGKPGE